MTIKSFHVIDPSGKRVTGTVEVYRDPAGKFYDPSSDVYQNSRYAEVRFKFEPTSEVCTIDRNALPRHKAIPLGDLEWLLMPAILLRQFRIFYRGEQPVGVAPFGGEAEMREQVPFMGDQAPA